MTPIELEVWMTDLYGVWLEIESKEPEKAVPCIKRVMKLMPRDNREVEAFCGAMSLQLLYNSNLPQFNDYEKFTEHFVEAYSMMLHNGKVTPTRFAAAAAALTAEAESSDVAILAAALTASNAARVDARATIQGAGGGNRGNGHGGRGGGAGRGGGNGGNGRGAGGRGAGKPLEVDCDFCNFKYCLNKKGGKVDACVVCNHKLKVPDSTTSGARRFLECARAIKFEKGLSSMKGVTTSMERTMSEAKAVYEPTGIFHLGSDGEEVNSYDIGSWGTFEYFHESDDEGYYEPGLFATASEYDIKEMQAEGMDDTDAKELLSLPSVPRLLPGIYAERHFGTFDDYMEPFSDEPGFYEEPVILATTSPPPSPPPTPSATLPELTETQLQAIADRVIEGMKLNGSAASAASSAGSAASSGTDVGSPRAAEVLLTLAEGGESAQLQRGASLGQPPSSPPPSPPSSPSLSRVSSPPSSTSTSPCALRQEDHSL